MADFDDVYLSLGSNLGDRLWHLRAALERIAPLATVTACSHVYETEPVEFTAQPSFLNAAIALRVPAARPPVALLRDLLAIEQELGRRRDLVPAKGPRSIDLDILFYGQRVMDTEELTVPHPALAVRRFVLEPLAEIAPELVHPVLHRSVRQLLQALPREEQSVHRVGRLLRNPADCV